LIEAFNPYNKEDKYFHKRDSSIFDFINLDDNSQQFIKTFKNYNPKKYLRIIYKINIKY
jgi:hypothetical protein